MANSTFGKETFPQGATWSRGSTHALPLSTLQNFSTPIFIVNSLSTCKRGRGRVLRKKEEDGSTGMRRKPKWKKGKSLF